jgi:hypothetical protein
MTTLQQCIAGVESGHRLDAIRFEPDLFSASPQWVRNQITKIQYAHGGSSACSVSTATMLACSSFGLYQILGANIYAGNFKNTVFAYIADQSLQNSVFAEFIKPHGFVPDDDLTSWTDQMFTSFATFYNGPNAPAAYVAAMRKNM